MTGEFDDLPDTDLIARAREGDALAYGALWKRHWAAARAMATSITSRFDPDDLASEAFARILTSISRGKGPTAGFRPYLATTVRNVAIDWSRRKTTPNIENADVIEDWTFSEVAVLDQVERETMAQAFYALPDKWQEVLWYTEVEDMAPREVAPIMGLKPNAVSALALRAREGLRQAWINAHLASAPSEDPIHGWTLKKLGAFTRGRLAAADRRKVAAHLDACRRCADAAAEANDVGSRLALVILPLFLGLAGATAYLESNGSAGGGVAAGAGGTKGAVAVSIASGGSKAGMAAVAAGMVTAAALTYGTIAVMPETELTASEFEAFPESGNPADGSPGRRGGNGRAVGPEQRAQLRPPAGPPRSAPVNPVAPEPDGPADDASPAPAPGEAHEGAVPVTPPVAPPDSAPSPSPHGCEAAIRAIPAEDTLFAYRLDDAPESPTARDLVHGTTAQYSGQRGTSPWSLSDEIVRQPTDRFTIQVWFRSGQGGGRLLGFSGSAAAPSAYYDRHLFLADDGRVVFGVFPGDVRTISSTASYTDDRWHQATATLSSDGMALYVDGARVAHDPSVTTAHAFAGFWRIGVDNLDNWGPDTPASRQLSGSLAFAAVYSVALSADDVRAQWGLCQ